MSCVCSLRSGSNEFLADEERSYQRGDDGAFAAVLRPCRYDARECEGWYALLAPYYLLTRE